MASSVASSVAKVFSLLCLGFPFTSLPISTSLPLQFYLGFIYSSIGLHQAVSPISIIFTTRSWILTSFFSSHYGLDSKSPFKPSPHSPTLHLHNYNCSLTAHTGIPQFLFRCCYMGGLKVGFELGYALGLSISRHLLSYRFSGAIISTLLVFYDSPSHVPYELVTPF